MVALGGCGGAARYVLCLSVALLRLLRRSAPRNDDWKDNEYAI
jgi:hypothetical protein